MRHLALILLLAGAALAQYQPPLDTTPSLSLGREFGIYATEFGGAIALPGCPGGFAAAAMSVPTVLDLANYVSYGQSSDEQRAIIGGIVSLGVWPVIGAFGCYWVGRSREPGGNYLATLAGAVTGSAAGFGAWYAWNGLRGDRHDNVAWVTLPAVFLGSAAGAVYGYNVSMWQNTDRQFSATRFLPPYATAHDELIDEGVRATTVTLNLLSLRI